MNRTQWKIFAVGMCGLFPALGIALPNAQHHPWLLVLPAFFFVLLFGGTFGWMAVRGVQNSITRRRGVPMIGHVVHARSVGYTNNVPTWEIDVALPTGVSATLLIVRYAPFTPGESLAVLVDPKHPTHAVRPAQPSYDF